MSVTIKDIALAAGVSITSVSLVLNNKPNNISEKTKEKIYNAVKKLNYTPNYMAKSLRNNRTNIIGLIVPTLSNPYFSEIASSIRRKFQENNYQVFISETFYDYSNYESIFNLFLEFKVAGIVYVKSGEIDAEKEIETASYFKNNGIPCICIDSESSLDTLHSVNSDNIYGGYIATNYLISLGHRRIGCLSGPLNVLTSNDRVIGYNNALHESNIPHSYIYEGSFGSENSLDALHYFLENKCTAIFASNDLMACGLYKAARIKNIFIPDDISIIGYDNISLSQIISPELTTINQNIQSIVESIYELFHLNLIKASSTRKITILPELIIRESCKPVIN